MLKIIFLSSLKRFSVMKAAVLVLLSLLAACDSGGVNVVANFANTQDIEEGAAVYYEQHAIGEVSDVSNSDSGSLVQLTLDESVANQIDGSAALVVNRLKEGAPLEIYNRPSADNVGLTSGQELKGLDSMIQLGAWMVGDAIQLGAGSLSSYAQAFQEYLQGDEFQQDKLNFEQKMNEVTVAASGALKSLEQDIEKASSEFEVTEEEVAAVIEELGEELSPVAEELSRSGAQLMQELEKFALGLEDSNSAEQKTGQQFLESLTAALEKLNESIEKGAAEAPVDDAPELQEQ